jgi:hypothetical protein
MVTEDEFCPSAQSANSKFWRFFLDSSPENSICGTFFGSTPSNPSYSQETAGRCYPNYAYHDTNTLGLDLYQGSYGIDYYSPTFPLGEWVHYEAWFFTGDNTNSLHIHEMVNGRLTRTWDGDGHSLYEFGSADEVRRFRLGQVSGSNYLGGCIQIGDVYIDNTQSHVFLYSFPTMSSMWTEATSLHHSEVQVPHAWSDSSISIILNQGSFYTITDTNNDGYDAQGDNTPLLDYNYIRLGTHWSDYISGFRFTNIDIPHGATIDEARLGVVSMDDTTNELDVNIYAEDVDDAQAMTGSTSLSLKQMTSNFVNWQTTQAWSSGELYSGPNISSVIQEVIDRPGWQAGNSITIIVDHDDAGYYRSVYHAGGGNGAVLDITYSKSGIVTKGVIPMNSGNPFYTTTQNPYSCGDLDDGESCSITYLVASTGPDNVTYDFYALARSDTENIESAHAQVTAASYHEADTNTDGCISFSEVTGYFAVWLSGSATIGDLFTVVNYWKAGCYM